MWTFSSEISMSFLVQTQEHRFIKKPVLIKLLSDFGKGTWGANQSQQIENDNLCTSQEGLMPSLCDIK